MSVTAERTQTPAVLILNNSGRRSTVAINPTGQLSNYKQLNQVQTSIQKAERSAENQDFNANKIRHSNPGIKDPTKVVTQNMKNLEMPMGQDLNLQQKLGTTNNQLDLLA